MPNHRSSKQTYSLNPLLWLAIGFAIGIAAENFFEIGIMLPAITATAAAALSIFLRSHSVATVLVFILFFLAGWSLDAVEKDSVSADRVRQLFDDGTWISGEPVEIEGKLSGASEPTAEGYFLTLRSDRALADGKELSISGRVRAFVPLPTTEAITDFSNLELTHGSRIRIACLLEREEKYSNPGFYSRKLLLDRQGIDATANLKSPLLIEKVWDANVVDRSIGTVFELRVALIRKFREMFSPRTAGILIASMLGNKYFLDKNTADLFREGGTFHVLVISGLHITFIGGLILLLVRNLTRSRWIQAIATISLLWLYGIAVGGDVPVIRACVMFTILMIGYAEFRTSTLLNSLAASALVLLGWRPSDLFDPSFQLTFVSVAAILGIGLPLISKFKAIGAWVPSPDEPFPPNVPDWLRRLCETIYWNDASWTIHRSRQIWKAQIIKTPYFARLGEIGLRRTIVFVFESIVISAAVQICLLPLLVYYFHRFPLLSIPLNVWVGGVLAAESISAVFAAMISIVSETLAFPFIALAESFNWLIVTLPSYLSGHVISGLRYPIYSGTLRSIYLLYSIPLTAVAFVIALWDPFELKKTAGSVLKRWMPVGVLTSLVLLAAVILFHPYSAPTPDGNLHIDFLDVGQGDAALVTFPDGKTMLIDAGGKLDYRDPVNDEEQFEPDVPRIGEAVVSEFLWERGISRVDMIVATHADADHIQGLSDIIRNFSVRSAYLGRIDDDPELKPLLVDLDRFGIERSVVHAAESLEMAGVRIDVLNPLNDSVSANNGSVVLKFTFGETSFLFTGDIEMQAEAMMLQAGTDLHADVIKVPHHGSRSSSTDAFVNAVRPQYAIISVGRRSVFGHPHREVVERWKASGAEVMTTGERGTISIVSDGKEIAVSRFLSQ